MAMTEQYRNEFLNYLEVPPPDKVEELRDFADFLVQRSNGGKESQIDDRSLRMQQQALKPLWDDPEEDLYEL